MYSSWEIRPANKNVSAQLSADLGVSNITAQILVARGITDSDSARAWLNPSLNDLHDPFLLPDMETAIDRLLIAVQKNESVTIYGDYDVDGVCSTTIILKFLRAVGMNNVSYYIPHRTKEGYGLNAPALKKIAHNSSLLITVDTGSVAHNELIIANELGLDVIVTDHHEVSKVPDSACAIINPKRSDCEYPFQGLCGAGVAFKLLMALRRRLRENGWFTQNCEEPNLLNMLDLVSVATVADIVPLIDENRILCRAGFAQLVKRPSPGLAALLKVASVKPEKVDTYAIAFQIAPRLNAAGRMAHAELAVQLLLSEDKIECEKLAEKLNDLNMQRQKSEAKIQRDIVRQLESDPLLIDRHSIVMANKDWSPGIVGIVAGRIAETYRLPTIIIGGEGEFLRGSARTIGDFPLLAAIEHCSEYLEAFGGHAAAAGVTLRFEQVDNFIKDFEVVARELLTPKMREKILKVDAQVDAADLNVKLVSEIAQMGPYGLGNREPVLMVTGMEVADRKIVGKDHLKLTLASESVSLKAIAFGAAEHQDASEAILDVAGIPSLNVWNGNVELQFKIKDLKAIFAG